MPGKIYIYLTTLFDPWPLHDVSVLSVVVYLLATYSYSASRFTISRTGCVYIDQYMMIFIADVDRLLPLYQISTELETVNM